MEGINLKKNLLRASAFLLVLTCALFFVNWMFTPKKYLPGSNTSFYRSLPENSIDVLYTGASGLGCGITPTAIWSEYGITGYNISSSLQTSLTTYYTLLDALESQSPELVVMDAGMLLRKIDVDSQYLEPMMRRSIATMRMSEIKAAAINDIVSRSENQTIYGYYIPLLGFHSRWGTAIESYPAPETAAYMGGFHYESVFPISSITPVDLEVSSSDAEAYAVISDEDEGIAVDETSAEYYEKIFSLCSERGIKVVIIKLPCDRWNYKQYCAVNEFCIKYGVDFIDMNMSEYLSDINLNLKTDYHDTVHLNISGAHKTSLFFGKLLSEKYGLEDKRNTDGYELYNEYAEQYSKLVNDYIQALPAE